ncbi:MULTISPECIES: 7-cyano-7-deazaguanine synthase QueC [Halomonadaceae]|uniref:7-cyano-7-deazaguanine synthase QueC n=1 Tax=Halomonadaceae TaxID=28256 RepID=UPI0015971F30|nr:MULTISPECIES: 7-cyano-7-deazaguanine synthase QueC [Halomonas]QJQ94425.1 7-cyano-7-deazaguanine synthase QueC [Halomonas sp. PA5]
MSCPSNASPAAHPRAVVIYSGGMDSYTVLHRILKEGYEVHALSFDYGQRHACELDVARRVCQRLGIAHQVIDIRAIHGLIDNSALTDASRALPAGEYDGSNMAATVVPNRNMILLSLAIAQAVNIGADKVFYGAHGGDHVLYPDCRPEFVERMNDVAAIANFDAIQVVAPYLHVSKTDILADGLAMQLDYSQTWTCYLGGSLACGECGSCQERLAAFRDNDREDPLSYFRRPESSTAVPEPGRSGKDV